MGKDPLPEFDKEKADRVAGHIDEQVRYAAASLQTTLINSALISASSDSNLFLSF